MIAITSRQAYDEIKAKLPAKRKRVLEIIERMSECCNKTLAWRMNLPVNCITPRTGELREQGLIINTKVEKISGYNHQYFRAARPERLF